MLMKCVFVVCMLMVGCVTPCPFLNISCLRLSNPMAILHVLRSGLYIARGWYDRATINAAKAAAFKGTPAPSSSPLTSVVPVEDQPAFIKGCLSCATDVTVPIYMGFRMADAFGHVNNSRYLEAFEFGRWYQMGLTGLESRTWYAGVYPVVSSVSIQYLKEIKPLQWVVCRTKGPFNIADDRTMKFIQQLESQDGKTVYATASLRVCILNLPFKKPTGTLGKSMQITKKGIIPPEEVLDRCFCFEEERAVANRYRAGTNTGDGGNGAGTTPSIGAANELFDPSVVKSLNEIDAKWRTNVLTRVKEMKSKR